MSRLLGVALRSIHSGMSAARIERLAKLVAYLRATRTPRPFSEIRQEDGFDAYAGPVAASGERAFERDKADLLRAGIPIIYVEETDEVGPGYMIDEPREGVALNLSMYDRAIYAIVGSVAECDRAFPRRSPLRSALTKLAVLGGDESLVAIEVSLEEPSEPSSHLAPQIVEWSLRQSSLQITYSDGKGRESLRRVDAWGIFRSDGRYFMVGYCHLRKGRRVFAIHRIIKADLLSSAPGRIIPPEGWDRDLAIDSSTEWFVHEARRAVLRVPALREGQCRKLFSNALTDVRETDDENFIELHVEYGNTEGLLSRVWSAGSWCQLLGPDDLREEAGRILRKSFDAQKGVRFGCA